jgi:hypothetical protein
LPL